MPSFKVIRRKPAVYQEVWEVDASDKDEAERAIASGRGKCRFRSFGSTSWEQPAGFHTAVLDESEPTPDGDFNFPNGVGQHLKEFLNARFHEVPGAELQTALQVFDE